LKYLAMRRGITTSYSLAWSIPWLGPTQRSMWRFGAFCPQLIFPFLHGGERDQQGYALGGYWRIVTSALWVTSSVAEWGLLLLAWWWAIPPAKGVQQQQQQHQYSGTAPYFLGGRPNHSSSFYSSDSFTKSNVSLPMSTTREWPFWWPVVYTLSTLTGQLWMVAFDYYGGKDGGSSIPPSSGCTSWGTAGLLCARGMQWPDRRLENFVLAIGLVLLNVCQPITASVFGAIGASFFGWAYAGMWLTHSTTTPTAVMNNNNNKTTKTKSNGGGVSSWHHHYYSYDIDNGNLKEVNGPRKYYCCTGRWTFWNMVATICTVSLWVVPTVYLLAYP
jgi:hypothetical protein